MRHYDPRIGRFLSLDPLAISYPNLTPYQYASNSPIANIDLDGLESLYFQITHDKKTGKPSIKLADIKTSYLDKILPYHVVVSVDGGKYMYAGDYALSFEGQRKELVKDLVDYAKNPQAAVKKFTQMKEDAEIAHQENTQFIQDLFTNAVTVAWASKTKKGTYTDTSVKSESQGLLSKALKRQGLKKPTEQFKEKWSEGGYDYEVRIHKAQTNAPEGSNSASGTTYRVARRSQEVDVNGQGKGWEYADDKGNWIKQSELKSGQNQEGANSTHIPLPKT